MPQFLELSAADQRLTIEQSAARNGWAASSVEKDFWVCWSLQQLFAMPDLAPHLTFKGGTSLSKAWGLIDRFSEDIDLTIHRDALGFGGENSPERAPTAKQRAKRLKALKVACGAHVRDVLLPELEGRFAEILGAAGWTLQMDAEDVDAQTLLFRYPSHFQPEAAYVRPIVKMEFGARSDPWPVSDRLVRPVIADHFPQAVERAETAVHALAPERTFWEKAMLLHEETFRPAGKARRPRMARHYYDLYRLIEQGIGAGAANDKDLFDQVAAHREVFFAQSWVDYTALKAGRLRLTPLPEQEVGWRNDYAAMQDEMFSATPPEFDVVLAAIKAFEQALRF